MCFNRKCTLTTTQNTQGEAVKRIRGVILVAVAVLVLFSGTFPAIASAREARLVFDPNRHTLTYFSATGARKVYRATGGADWCPDVRRPCKTPAGTYRIGIKYGPEYRSKTYPLACYRPCKDSACKPKSACGAIMPHFMKFAGKRFGIHAGTVSRNNSHGCIHVPSSVARFLSDTLPIGTPVTVLPYLHR